MVKIFYAIGILIVILILILVLLRLTRSVRNRWHDTREKVYHKLYAEEKRRMLLEQMAKVKQVDNKMAIDYDEASIIGIVEPLGEWTEREIRNRVNSGVFKEIIRSMFSKDDEEDLPEEERGKKKKLKYWQILVRANRGQITERNKGKGR